MRRITSAITMIALAFSLVASATPANALVPGFDSEYAGESAFLNLARGQQGSFTVFFANTGTTSWVRGTATQVDLAACLEDKVTCNQQDATEAPFNDGWLSATRYTTQSQTTVAPGTIGTFAYNVRVPAAAAAGTYRFNGALVLSATGADIRNQGYYQDVTVAAATTAATITTLTPNTGSNAGGTSVRIDGTGFVCTPALPTVNFGANAGTVTSCGATVINVTSPAGAVGNVDVTVTNQGAAASNAATFTYADTTAPQFTGVAAHGNTVRLTFNEPVCRRDGAGNVFAATDFTIMVNGVANVATADNAPTAPAAGTPTNCVTAFDVTVTTPFVAGDNVAVTLTAGGAAKFRDVAGNAPSAQTQTTVATADTTRPSISSAAARNTTTIRLTYNEAVICNNAGFAQFSATPTGGAATTATGLACTTTQPGSTTVDVTFPAATFASGTGGSVTYTQSATAADRIKDRVGNDAVSPQTVGYSAFTADTARPLSQDIRMQTNAGLAGSLDGGDIFTVAFNEVVTVAAGATIRLQDGDGSVGDVVCGTNATCTLSVAARTIGGTSFPAGQVVQVTMTGTPTVVTAGTIGGIQIPATVIDASGIADASGNLWDIPNSPDRVLN